MYFGISKLRCPTVMWDADDGSYCLFAAVEMGEVRQQPTMDGTFGASAL